MGYGWTHSYNVFLFNQRGHMFLMDARGRIERHKLGPGGTFITGPGYFDQLVQTSNTTFTLTTKDKTISTFTLVPSTPFFVGGGAVYRLTSIVDRNNNVTILTYVNGNLTSVTDTYGRSLTLGYNSQNKLISITDPLLRTTTLEYDSTGR